MSGRPTTAVPQKNPEKKRYEKECRAGRATERNAQNPQHLLRLETHVDGRRRRLRSIPSSHHQSTTASRQRRIRHLRMDPAREPLAGGLQRRPAAAARAGGGPQEPPPGGQRAIHADVDPQPRPWPWMQKVAILAIVLLGCLQFLPATHFRDPNDPHRNWIPFDGSRNPTVRHRAPGLTCSLCVWNCGSCLLC
jgi:hypothetical protein